MNLSPNSTCIVDELHEAAVGINQLDGRRVDVVPDDEGIPNPARRRLLNALHNAHVVSLRGPSMRRQKAILPLPARRSAPTP